MADEDLDTDPICVLYDEIIADEKLKHGTKYERLAALVFKHLRQDDTVTHDVRLRGEGRRTWHQIDVRLATLEGTTLRAIVECRHLFGKAGRKKLGLGAVRDFASVQRDLEADEAWMVTTGAFTGPATTYAEEQGIRLATLKPPLEPQVERIDPYETYFLTEDGEPDELFHDVIDPIYQRLQRGLTEGINAGTELFDRTRHVLVGEILVAVRGFEWEIELRYGNFDFSINLAQKIARLLLDSLDGRVHARFTTAQLSQWSVSPNDRVVQGRGRGTA